MAIASVRTKPFAPTKVGILPCGFSLRYSADLLATALTSFSVGTSSNSRPFALAATRIGMVRPLTYRNSDQQEQ